MKKYFTTAVLLLFQLIIISSASANPGFARKFGFSCSMCHSGFPNLNDFGEVFRDNGFQMPGQDIGDKAVKTGDSGLNLEPGVNFAARVDGFVSYRNDTNTHSDIAFPSLLKLFIFGYLKKDITFYTYYLANEEGKVAGLEDAYVYFNNVGNHELDVMIGQFQVADFVYSRELRLTHQDILIYTTSIKNRFDLTYHRGAALMFAPGNWELDMGLVNGNGIGPTDTARNFDNNSFKDPFLRLNWKQGPFSVGLYGIYGEDQDNATKIKNRFYRMGPDIRIKQWIPSLDVKAQWLFGEDQNPDYLPNPGDSLKITGGFAEALYHIRADWKCVLLYNRIQVTQQPFLNANTLSANLTYYILRNFKTYLEYTYDMEDQGINHPEKTDSAEIVLVLAF